MPGTPLLIRARFSQTPLTFTKLSDCMQYLPTAAAWTEGEWGYIRKKGVEFRTKVMHSLKEHVYIATLAKPDPKIPDLANQPIALFALLPYEFDNQLTTQTKRPPHTLQLMYVFVDKEYRGLGFGKQIINEAKRLAKVAHAEFIVFDILKTSLYGIYHKAGAEMLNESRLFTEPVDAMVMKP